MAESCAILQRRLIIYGTKTKSSYRTLPLVGPFEELLLRIKAEQARWTCSDGAADRDRFAFSPPTERKL